MEAVEEVAVASVRILNITKHFAQRWAERILLIGQDIFDRKMKEQAIKEYAAIHFEQIKEHANKTFQFSTFIWQGQLYDNITKKYYIEDDIVFVVDTTGDTLRTTYKVDFGFPGVGNSQARKSLIQEIHHLVAEKEEIDFNILVEMEKKQHEAEVLNENIRILQEQLNNARDQKSFVELEMKNMNRASHHLDLEIKKYTNMLVNSKEYREDLKEM